MVNKTVNQMKYEAVSAEITGEQTLLSFGIGMNPAFAESLSYADHKFLCSGNLDAPMLLPAGSVRVGYEGGVVCRNIDRG